jgi:hypothetical protein
MLGVAGAGTETGAAGAATGTGTAGAVGVEGTADVTAPIASARAIAGAIAAKQISRTASVNARLPQNVPFIPSSYGKLPPGFVGRPTHPARSSYLPATADPA